ncbi:MAG: hypothetical protein HYU66_01480 [Armatimonadetes bacterium]|nr:hypothetical protein [Armatimonadota bacterium]
MVANPAYCDRAVLPDQVNTRWGGWPLGEVTAVVNDATVQGQEQNVLLADWGTYTYEICVSELGPPEMPMGGPDPVVVDDYYAKWPYYTTIPKGTGGVGHGYFWDWTGTHWKPTAHYFVDDASTPATEIHIDLIDPKLALLRRTDGLPTDIDTFHEGISLGEYRQDEIYLKPYIGVFCGVDGHGNDPPGQNWHPRYYREREDKRIIAVNDRPAPAVLIKDVEWVPFDTQSNNIEDNPGGGLRIFPYKYSGPEDDPTNRAKVKVKVTIVKNPVLGAQAPSCDGQSVWLYLFDVDDPSPDRPPEQGGPVIDPEQTCPDPPTQSWALPQWGNLDNRGASQPGTGGWCVLECSGTADEASATSLPLNVSLQPGDNYRVVAVPFEPADGLEELSATLAARPADSTMGVWQIVPNGAGWAWRPVPATGQHRNQATGQLEVDGGGMPGGPPGGEPIKASCALTVWQRVFYEYDRMYEHGEELATTALPNTTQISVYHRSDVAPGTVVRVFDLDHQAGEQRTVVAQSEPDAQNNVVLTLDAALAASYRQDRDATCDWGELYEVPAATMLSRLIPAFVDWQQAPSGAHCIPSQVVDDVGAEGLTRWFLYSENYRNVIHVVAGKYAAGAAGGRSRRDVNASWVFCRQIHDNYAEEWAVEMRQHAVIETLVHELGHQWMDHYAVTMYGGEWHTDESHGLHSNRLATDGCVMIYDRRFTSQGKVAEANEESNGIAEFGWVDYGGGVDQGDTFRGQDWSGGL